MAWRILPGPLSSLLVTVMVFPCGRGVDVSVSEGIDVGGCVGISVGIAVGNIATDVEVVVGVHATNNKMPKNIVIKKVFILSLSFGQTG